MEDELRKAVERRAYALWEAAGRPSGGDLEYWLQAEQELVGLSVAGEEDPYVALDDLAPGDVSVPDRAKAKQ
jgi:hypothetical protein